MYCLYCHRNKVNGKRYFGVTSQRPTHRWNNGNSYKSCSRFYAAIKKYGWDSFEHVIIAEGLKEDEAHSLECAYIREYDTTNPNNGYNQSTGGSHGSTGVKLTNEQKQRISDRFKGKPLSEEHKRKISESAKGRKLTEEQKKRIGDAKRGTRASKETRERMSKAHKGKEVSELTRQKIRDARRNVMRKVYCEETDTIYESGCAAAKALGVSQANLSATCRGKHKHVGGYHVRYLD